jgi:hypothetical protein
MVIFLHTIRSAPFVDLAYRQPHSFSVPSDAPSILGC